MQFKPWLLLIGTLAVQQTGFSQDTSFYVEGRLDSQYVSKGRLLLKDGGVAWAEMGAKKGALSGYVALGRGTDEGFTELDLGIDYLFKPTKHFTVKLGYDWVGANGENHLRYRGHEFDVVVAYKGLAWLTPSWRTIYETKSDGYFTLVDLKGNIELTPKLKLHPYLQEGWDFGYSTKKHDGQNHRELGVKANYQLTSQLELSTYVAHTWALSDVKLKYKGDGRNHDETFGGIKLHYKWK
ncbi:hypothetical protein [Parashewanella tropica]|uniref:hypothetical protein n=1 Tax=Parashewanella tropica TaxID=2547970 RepID=UPI00105A03D2|nr:hypothetical protein [Parashewanella tropica]